MRRSVDLELERCRQQAGFTVIKEKEEPWTLAPEADSAEAGELLEPTLEEWRQVSVARCRLLERSCHQRHQGLKKKKIKSPSM